MNETENNSEIRKWVVKIERVMWYLLVYASVLILGSGANPAQENHSLLSLFTNTSRVL